MLFGELLLKETMEKSSQQKRLDVRRRTQGSRESRDDRELVHKMDAGNHLERAKRLLGPNMPILSGNGRWCLRTPMGAYLFNSRDEAERSVLDPSSKYVRIFDIGTDEPARTCRTVSIGQADDD
jgi:hypothetical protein